MNENISDDEGADKGLIRYTNKRICEYNEKVCFRRRLNPITTEEMKLAFGILILAKALLAHFYLIFFNRINTALVQNKSPKTFGIFLSGFCFQKSRSVTYPK